MSAVTLIPPTALTAADAKVCLAILREGGAVDVKQAATQLPRAQLIALRREAGVIVGLGAIKSARPDYLTGLAHRSGVTLPSDGHELGYVAVRASQHGKRFSTGIVTALLAGFPARPLFATTAHPRMKATLAKAGFQPVGKEWPGVHGALSLWVLDNRI
jgi:hypothetical protein